MRRAHNVIFIKQNSMSVPMASKDQLEQWKALGGTVEAGAKKGAKKDSPSVFIAPSGEHILQILLTIPVSSLRINSPSQGKS